MTHTLRRLIVGVILAAFVIGSPAIAVSSPDTTAIWPSPGSTAQFATPEEAAQSFATEFLGFQSPVLETFQAGDNRSGEIPLRPREQGPVTTLLLRQVGSSDDWSVLGAVSANIEVTSPVPFTEVKSPIRVTGKAMAFEGTWQVEVRADDTLAPLGTGFVTGASDMLSPFDDTISFDTPSVPHGTIVFYTTSAEDGQVWEASTLRVAFDSTPTGELPRTGANWNFIVLLGVLLGGSGLLLVVSRPSKT